MPRILSMTLPIAKFAAPVHFLQPMAEVSLLSRVAAGESDAMAKCVDQFGPLIWSAAKRFLGSSHEAEDAVQEIFIHLWREAHRFDPSLGSESTFIMVIARRRLIDWRRRMGRQPQLAELDSVEDTAEEKETVEGSDDEAELAVRLLRSLPSEQQRVIELSLRDGHTHQEISSRLAMPLGTVKTLLRRGLLRMRQALGGERERVLR